MKTYHFNVTLAGSGKDADEAWQDACEAFSLDSGGCPDESECEVVEDTLICTICDDPVDRGGLREHLEGHNPNARGFDPEEVGKFFEED